MNKTGFTLIEILIALAVFAVLATITSSAMYYAFNTRTRVTEQADRLVNLQLAISIMERDTIQAVDRPIRGNEMHLFPAFVGTEKHVEFTRDGIINPAGLEKRSTLKRIAYHCQGGQLLRRSWESLDTINRDKYNDRVLLDNVEKCKFAYLDQNVDVLSEWQENALQQNQKKQPLPKAVQLSLSLKDWDTLSLLFILPKALYANQ